MMMILHYNLKATILLGDILEN